MKNLCILSLISIFISFVIGENEPYQPDPSTLIYLGALNLTVTNRQTKEQNTVTFDKPAIVTSSPTSQNVSINFNFGAGAAPPVSVTNLQLNIVLSNGSGYLEMSGSELSGSIKLDGEAMSLDFTNTPLVSSIDLASPLSFSFHCSNFGPLFPQVTNLKDEKNATVSLKLIDFQIQSFMGNNSMFSSSYDCVGFFTIGILSGWFMSLLLIALLSWGIKMVMSINTMDRFDDPKGKSITVSATD